MTSVSSEFDARMDMKAFIDRARRPYELWYVGIAADPRDRLFNEHGVREEEGWWIVKRLASAEAARRVEAKLLELGCDGLPGQGGDEASTSVYAYLKTEHTSP